MHNNNTVVSVFDMRENAMERRFYLSSHFVSDDAFFCDSRRNNDCKSRYSHAVFSIPDTYAFAFLLFPFLKHPLYVTRRKPPFLRQRCHTRMLERYSFSSFPPSSMKNTSACRYLHSCQKTMRSLSFSFFGLIGSFRHVTL